MNTRLFFSILAGVVAATFGGYMYMTDRMTGDRWNKLTPKAQRLALQVVSKAQAAGLNVMFYDGWRSAEEQKKNMDKGTSWVSDPYSSKHVWGIAFDIVFKNAAGLPTWPDPKVPGNKALWTRLGEIGEGLGLFWGGRWDHFDGPHLQLTDVTVAGLKRQYGENVAQFLRDKGVLA